MIDSEIREFYFGIFEKMDEMIPTKNWIQECRLMTILMPKPNNDEDKYLIESDEYLSLVKEYRELKP